LQSGKSPHGLAPFLVADKDGVTPIHIAAAGNGKILQMFIDAVCPTDDVFGLAQDKRGRGPLHYAASKASVESVKLILDSPSLGLPVDAKDASGLTPLMCAVGVPFAQGVDVCRLLARRKEMSISARNRNGLSAIHLAAIANNLPVLKLFAEEMGKSVEEIKDRENRSCLMWAVCAGNVEVIEYLVRKTSPDRQARDNHGFTALHLAAMVGNENICKVLVRQGWNLSERDKLDNTPLHLAAGRGHTDVVRFLVTAGANMNEKDAMDRTPVYWACFGGQAHTLYCMIKELGFEWRTVDKHRRVPITDALGQTPLHASAFAGFTACINVLLNIEAEDDCLISPLTGWKDKHGETALHVACTRGKMDCVLALLKGGAAPNAVNDAKKTCLQCAIDNKHSNIAEYLRSQGALVFTELSETAARVIQSWWRTVTIRRRLRQIRI
uniref:ANK_REP_REGION domain-containing protein n=1 Tax=Angiostrongylus cantonensis TaxID=6313 RepID=A0A158P7C6_ANGCA